MAPGEARRDARVVREVDGVAVDLAIDGKTERVRLIGVTTPESVDPRRPVECLGREPSAKAKEMLAIGGAARVAGDPTKTSATATAGCCSTSGCRTAGC